MFSIKLPLDLPMAMCTHDGAVSKTSVRKPPHSESGVWIPAANAGTANHPS